MARLARAAANDPEFREFLRTLGTLRGAEAWVRMNYVYRDETEEIVRTPQFMLADVGRIENDGRVVGLEGDCDDISTFLAAVAVTFGYRTRLKAIRYNPSNPNFEHVFPEVYDGGRWRIIDATISPGAPMEWIEEMNQEV
jgi:hypothetical protein